MIWPKPGDQLVASWMHAAATRLTDSASALMRCFPGMRRVVNEHNFVSRSFGLLRVHLVARGVMVSSAGHGEACEDISETLTHPDKL